MRIAHPTNGFMVDFLAGELADPVGLPVHDGVVKKVAMDGSLEWSSFCRKSVDGSFDSSMTFRAMGSANSWAAVDAFHGFESMATGPTGLQVSGNPAKFLNGHNLYGSDDVAGLLEACLLKAAPALWPDLDGPPPLHVGDFQISRIDLTASWLMDRESDVVPFLRAMEATVWCPYRGRGVMSDVGTLYYGRTAKGKRAKDWQLKIYAKGLDIGVHRLPDAAYLVPGLLDVVNRTVRVELTLRRSELKRLGLMLARDWTPEQVAKVWKMYVDKLDFGDATLNTQNRDLQDIPGIKNRHLAEIGNWRAGNDPRLKKSPATFYRLRKEILALTGLDIALARPASNVVPLTRIIAATPVCGRPSYADKLDAVLAA